MECKIQEVGAYELKLMLGYSASCLKLPLFGNLKSKEMVLDFRKL